MSLDEQVNPGGQPQFPQFPAPPPARQRISGLAITGFVLTFLIVPLGFVLSLIAIFRTGQGKARGRGLAVAGTILSLLFIGIGTAVVVTVAGSTVADPGCLAAKKAILHTAQGNDLTSLQATADQLNAAAGKAEHDDVRVAAKAMADDFTQLVAAAKTGNLPAGLQDKIAKDAAKIDELCTVGS